MGMGSPQPPPPHPGQPEVQPGGQVETQIERRRRLGRERQQRFRNRKRAAAQTGLPMGGASPMNLAHPALNPGMSALAGIPPVHIQAPGYGDTSAGTLEEQAAYQVLEVFKSVTQVGSTASKRHIVLHPSRQQRSMSVGKPDDQETLQRIHSMHAFASLCS